jgi:uncharacterized protein YyaL (SSP411 family)
MNRLSLEKSPYLRQHATNPVDWYPWGEEAFRKAREENKPIFLSIGYASCHWCHVMARESFEDPEVARLLNQHFVPVKVDREERPEVDQVYMTFVQATTGQGGWPLNVWLTPDGKPFYGGTYFPKEDRWGRPGFLRVLERIAWLWENQKERLEGHGRETLHRLQELFRSQETVAPNPTELPQVESMIQEGFGSFARSFDRARGGFDGAPKFPRPAALFFLLRYAAWRGGEDGRAQQAVGMVVRTLEAMARGGIRDQLGGGFHRYSVDAEWRVPHFEKMLYDQAQLALCYLETFQCTGQARWARIAEETLEFVLRELSSPEGGCYSSLSADSADEKAKGELREGAFYLWTAEEIDELFQGTERELVYQAYGVCREGNVPPQADAQGELEGKNILWQAQTVKELALSLGRPPEEVASSLEKARKILWEHREKRPKPMVDDKVVTAWNALAISAFAKVGKVLKQGRFLHRGRECAEFLWSTLWLPEERRLLRAYRQGPSSAPGCAWDYAFLAAAFLDLFEALGDPRWLGRARTLQDTLDERFWDAKGGGYFTAESHPSLILRMKEEYDGAEPSPQSVAFGNLLRLYQWTRECGYLERAKSLLQSEERVLLRLPEALPLLLGNLPRLLLPPRELLVLADPSDPEGEELGSRVLERFLPFATVLVVEPARDGFSEELLEFPGLGQILKGDPGPGLYICQEGSCRPPIRRVEDAEAILEEIAPGIEGEVGSCHG